MFHPKRYPRTLLHSADVKRNSVVGIPVGVRGWPSLTHDEVKWTARMRRRGRGRRRRRREKRNQASFAPVSFNLPLATFAGALT